MTNGTCSGRRAPARDDNRQEGLQTTLTVLVQALDLKVSHGFSYWDSAIIAAAKTLGCRTLYSEDMAHGREIEGVLIVNPFR